MNHNDIGTLARYDAELEQMESVIAAMVGVSDGQGGIWISNRHTEATKVFTRITVTGITFLRLLPGSTLTFGRERTIWDWPSVASLCRNIVDAYLMFFYIGLDGSADVEWGFRHRYLVYHHNLEKYKLYTEWHAGPDVLDAFVVDLATAREALKADEVFATLLPWHQRRVLKGEQPMHLTRKQLLDRIPFATDELTPFQRLLSNQVHAAPFSFQKYSNERGRGQENEAERGYMTLAMTLARKYLAAAICGMAQLFPDHIGTGRAEFVATAQRHLAELTAESSP